MYSMYTPARYGAVGVLQPQRGPSARPGVRVEDPGGGQKELADPPLEDHGGAAARRRQHAVHAHRNQHPPPLSGVPP